MSASLAQKGTFLCVKNNGSGELTVPGVAPDFAYVLGDFFADGDASIGLGITAGGRIETPGYVRGNNMFVDKWYDNTVTDLSGVNVVVMPNATNSIPNSSFDPVTFAAGVWTFVRDSVVTLYWATLLSTNSTEIRVTFRKNGTSFRSFYSIYAPAAANAQPFSCYDAMVFSAGDTFSITADNVAGAGPANTAAGDVNGDAQTVLIITGVANAI